MKNENDTPTSATHDGPPPAAPSTERRYVSDRELAKLTSIAQSTWQQMRYAKEGPPWRKIGKRVVYCWEEVEAWIKAQPGGGEVGSPR